MKKLILLTGIFAAVFGHGATIQELNEIPTDKVTSTNAQEVFDALIATTNIGKMVDMVRRDKVTFEYAVRKTMDKKPLRMCLAIFKQFPAVTNYTLQAEVLSQLDYSTFDNISFDNVRSFIFYHRFVNQAQAKQVIALIFEANVLFGAEIYCSLSKSFETEAAAAYEAAKPLVKTQACPRQAMIIWTYGFIKAKDYDGFQQMYSKDLIKADSGNMFISSRPQYRSFMKDLLEALKANKKKGQINDDRIFKIAKTIDMAENTTTNMLNAIDGISSTKRKLDAALFCNSIDKMIDVLIACDDSLTAKDIEAVIAPLNGLDPNYRTADVLRALKAINQRYTLKLYDDRDSWEPVLSKIRAMIDCR